MGRHKNIFKMFGGKFLKPCFGLRVGKLVGQYRDTVKLIAEIRLPESLFESQKLGRLEVIPLVVVS